MTILRRTFLLQICDTFAANPWSLVVKTHWKVTQTFDEPHISLRSGTRSVIIVSAVFNLNYLLERTGQSVGYEIERGRERPSPALIINQSESMPSSPPPLAVLQRPAFLPELYGRCNLSCPAWWRWWHYQRFISSVMRSLSVLISSYHTWNGFRVGAVRTGGLQLLMGPFFFIVLCFFIHSYMTLYTKNSHLSFFYSLFPTSLSIYVSSGHSHHF